MKKKQINLELQLYSMRLDNGLAKKEKKKKEQWLSRQKEKTNTEFQAGKRLKKARDTLS